MPDDDEVEISETVVTEPRSASKVLIDALESFGESEPRSLVLIFTNDKGELTVEMNVCKAEAIGLCEISKFLMMP